MTLSVFVPSKARIDENRIVFSSGNMVTALRDGCLALQIPDGFDLAPGKKLAREFYLDPITPSKPSIGYRGFRYRSDIYFDREHFQTEHILADELQRKSTFPTDVNSMCGKMHDLARIVLQEILSDIGVAPQLWNKVTDSATKGGGIKWFAVNHYRPNRQKPGAPAHKDTGFITVLFCEQPGLEALINDQWMSIEPIEGYFLINFGGTLELLTKNLPIKVNAVLHRVKQCEFNPKLEDRYSFAAFINPSASCDIFQVSEDGQKAIPITSVEEFLKNFNKQTWQDNYLDFGITKKQINTLSENNNNQG
ncbi:isopenicillin N synthase family oxygenase [Photorhabdus heterorhabditis]|uniref:isopenicillin N synthase family oxygenase n=1 Tax=Photorhabdus heterorhabditis TaxID=880156 RepID=UPI001562760A|nr:isopenicillin N synthase family oxygenase [Photorhabdus heterorhabditis]NRN30780.1 isopenicillin N synthase family oxygenase [Photorhabdus heterorhabditis subsp. aluminescens]